MKTRRYVWASKIANALTPSMIDPFIKPWKFVTFVTMEPLNSHLKQQSKFFSNSQNVIESLKYASNKEDRFFGAVGIITWNSLDYRTGKLRQMKKYKGDDTIYEIF